MKLVNMSMSSLLPQGSKIWTPAFAGMTLLVMSVTFPSAHANIMQRLDGRVLDVNEKERALSVQFENPATGEFEEKDFRVRGDAGFKHFKELGTLKEGDLVSVDYLEEPDGLKAVYIIHVPLKLAYTSKKEVAKALFRIKTQ
jgi:hypothetical protein